MDKLKLSKPILINGNEVKELPYDLENMNARDKLNAGKEYKKNGGAIAVEELDSDYHLFLFAKAVSKADANIDTNDVLRISAKDATVADKIVRDFFYLDSEDTSQTDTSEEQ